MASTPRDAQALTGAFGPLMRSSAPAEAMPHHRKYSGRRPMGKSLVSSSSSDSVVSGPRRRPWLRRYHAYMFTLAKDGSQFGIAGKGHPHHRASGGYGAADLRGFQARDAYEVIDDRTVALGQVLRKVHDELFYLYDLGDGWNYSVTVMDVVDAPLPGATAPTYRATDLFVSTPV